MTCANGHKHGVFTFFSTMFVALCCLDVRGSGPPGDGGPGCGPCPLNCSCSPAGPQPSCVVNCSNIGLEKAPTGAELPPSTAVLDLSRNHISSLDTSLLNRLGGLRELYLQKNRITVLPRGVFCCGPLSILDLSNNKITTIDERICDNLCNLTQIDLSFNPFECDCKLFRVVSWLQEKGVQVQRAEAMLCSHPPELRHQPLLNISLLTCGLNYAACLDDGSRGGGGQSELVIFSSSTPGNFTREECNSLCFAASHRYGGLGARQECLCSTNSEPNFISESQCSAACTKPHVMKECGWTLAHDVFAVQFSVSLKPLPLQSVHNSISFWVTSTVTPVTLSWEFGDLSPRVNMTGAAVNIATHKYGLPGRYPVRVTAWGGHKEVSAHGDVTVALPPKLELHCPALTVANRSLDFRIVSWGAVDMAVEWEIKKDGVQVTKAAPYCPKDSLYHTESLNCFHLVPEELSWTEARQRCAGHSGNLAVVGSESVRNLLALRVTQERGVWLGLSDMDSPGTLRWVNGATAQEGLPAGSRFSHGNQCVSLDQHSQTSSHLCSAKRAFVCQYSPQVSAPNAGVFMVGLAVFPFHHPLQRPPCAALSAPPLVSSAIEVLLFPALTFIHGGRLSSLEFITQELSSEIHVRFQTYRPHCHHPGLHLLLPRCGSLACAPMAVCVHTDGRSGHPPSCPSLQQWCPFKQQCLPLSSPCHTSACPNCTHGHRLPPGTLRPRYSLHSEVFITLPAGPAAHILVQEELEDVLVSRGDVIALQHDAGPVSLLDCHAPAHSPWQQSVLAINLPEWFWSNRTSLSADISADQDSSAARPDPELDLEVLVGDGEGRWLEEVVCPLRVLYVGQSETQLPGAHVSAALLQPGLYSLQVTSVKPSYHASASCPLRVVPPLDLVILHPPIQNGTVYLQPNDTRLLLRVQSCEVTQVSWHGTDRSATFYSECPPEFAAIPGLCQPGSGSEAEVPGRSLFAVLDMRLGAEERRTPLPVELEAHSDVTEATLEVLIQLEEPLRGLLVQPHPARRVLMESVVSYTASVHEGSNPTFKWTVDDKPYFTYYNTVLNVIYQNAAIYKLTVMAMNHVSTLTEHFNVTVDRLQPMANLTVKPAANVVVQGAAQAFSAAVLVDMAVGATFRWSFGDGGYVEVEYRPPYARTLFCTDSPNQVLLSNNVTHVYTQPGVYTAQVSVSNRYGNISQRVAMNVCSVLSRVHITTVPQLLLVDKSVAFEAQAFPASTGISYTWHFGDDSVMLRSREMRVFHTYTQSGAVSVCVSVNNTISSAQACSDMFVYEEIEVLTAESCSPVELRSATTVSAHLASGNNITWTFCMGDGVCHVTLEPQVSHTYMKEGNYTVNVTAKNAVSSGWTLVPVQVFDFQILRIEPSGCVQELIPVQFQAWVSGNVSAHFYEWSFGDGSPNETHQGDPRVTHTYGWSGNYHLSLLLTSGTNKATKTIFFTWVCVQPVLASINLTLEKSHFCVGEDIEFRVKVEPPFNYSYLWDFGGDKDPVLVCASGNVMTTYEKPGHYLVSVSVSNNISTRNTTVLIDIQMPVGPVILQHNGSRYNNLTLGAPYTFCASSLASSVLYTWNFGDGNVFTGQNIIYSYGTSGNYNITLTATNTVSRNHTFLHVAVLAPIRGLTVNASLVNVPLNASVHFDAYMEEGDGVRFSWILCDRCTSIPGTHTMFYTFRSVGTFNIIVTAENDIGTAQASIFLFVQRELEGLQILAAEQVAGGGSRAFGGCCVATNKVLHLQAALKEGTNMTFTWNLIRELDPDTSSFNISGKTVDVNFSTPGPCDVFLRAANLLGHLSVNRTIYFIEEARGVHLQISDNPVAVNASTNLTVLTTEGSDLQYVWAVSGEVLQWNKSWIIHTFLSHGLKLVNVKVFNEVSSETVSDFISVQEVISGLWFSATNVTDQNYVAADVSVSLQGDVLTGTNILWTWLLDGRPRTGQKTSLVFTEPKIAVIILNATNDVSRQVVSREFFVQKKIQGLELKASKTFIAVGEKVEFSISMTAGSDVHLILSISGDSTIFQVNNTYVHTFTRVDTYIVNLTAYNQVSSKRRHLHVEVMEPVRGLSILECCPPAIPVGVRRTFEASIVKGKPIQFLWTFDLHNLHRVSHVGKEMSYTPEEAGLLIIYLKAFNLLTCQNVTKHVVVQNLLTAAILYAAPTDTFVNKTVTLMASVTPRSHPVACLWDFGDGSTPVHSDVTTVAYQYTHPGHYLVQVNCSNLVSWVLGQVGVNITVLECEEPKVKVVQAPRLAIWRSQPALVEAEVDLKGCIRYGAQYLWQILSTPSCENDKDYILTPGVVPQSLPVAVVQLPVEVDVQRLQLSLPKLAVAAGNYTLVFSLSYEGIPLRKAACLQLSIMAARLVPIIEGGTYRVWSRTQDLELSAEQSYDPNIDQDSQSQLLHHWECQSTSKGVDHCPSLNFSLNSTGPVLRISGSKLAADAEYTFKVTISKGGMARESTTQTVLVQSGRIPMVYLECVSCKAQSIYNISQNSYVYLKGTCTNCQSSPRGRWSAVTLQNETLVLNISTTTTGSDSMHLVLRQGVLHHQDSYVFTLHVTDDSLDGEGAASITLHHNTPPDGGECSLRGEGDRDTDSEGFQVHTLRDRIYFNCSGYSDLGELDTPLLYSLVATRCREHYCEDFCVYKGSSPEHSAFLPPGFKSSRSCVAVGIIVEDHQGAAIIALNKTIEVVLPDPPPGYRSLPHWLAELTDSSLRELLKQGDSQRVRELSLALITVLNEHEQTTATALPDEWNYRVRVRSNITRALTSLDLTTVNDIQQTSAALARCTAVSREFICEECQNSTLTKLESMLEILQSDTKQGTVTPTEIGDNILNIMGDLIHQVSQSASLDSPSSYSTFAEEQGGATSSHSSSSEPHPLRVAAKAYSLSSVLMLILMHARVLNEEPLVLRGDEIGATGKLADPQSLLCYHGNNSPECQQFSIPRVFNNSLGRAAAGNNVMQLLFQVESNPFPFNYVANYTVSTEVASMEFRTENGTHIPISGLDDSLAITVAMNNISGIGGGEVDPGGSAPAGVPAAVNISHCNSVIVRVSTGNGNKQAGLFIQLNFTSLQGAEEDGDTDVEEPYITAYLHSHQDPNEFNSTDTKHITLGMTRGLDLDHTKYTFFLSPESYDTTADYFINVSTACSVPAVGVRLEVAVFASLCQYFDKSEKQWKTDGMVPLAQTNTSRAVCRTRHLTAFAAGLFVPASSISFMFPERSSAPSPVVLLVCVLGLLSYAVAAAILHKLDQLDLRRSGVVPLCGRDGLFKYEIQVKTGWSRGAGTTAHVGISLYGRESRSGHRHLDSRGAFSRNALDIFHIATDTSLGSVWKIRIWHDNKGLSPAWMLQYVLVKDLQTGSSYYFQLGEWLSVDNERTGGQVEIEVEASEEAELLVLPRLLQSELQRAVCESHLWLSLWERPARSPFTRLQRATCCALLLQLFLLANTLWYSVVVDRRYSLRPVSQFSAVNGETVAAGLVSCLVVYPLYLLVFTLLRMSRSKCVSVEQVAPQLDQESVEIDDFLDNSLTGSSFLFFNGETNSEETNLDFPTLSSKSVDSLADEEPEDSDWPELLSDASVVGGAGLSAGFPRLKRGQGSRHLGLEMTLNPEDKDSMNQRNKYFTSSDEDLIKHILTDGQNFFPEEDESEMADLSSIFGDKTEVILLQKLSEPLPVEPVRRDPPKTAFTSDTVVTDVCRPRRFPPWCGRAALWGSWTAIAVANSVSVWAGHGFSQHMAMMWLISSFSSFLCSCLLLEPIKVLCEAVYYAVCVRRLRPEDQDVLVEFPRVERVVQRVPRVRPPHGFALSQARHQARKVHMLHTMLKNFLVYMFFLLVVLLLNYSDKDAHSLRLRTQLQRLLHTANYSHIRSQDDVLLWLNHTLLPRLLDGSTLLKDTGSVLMGTVRLRQIHDTRGISASWTGSDMGSTGWVTSQNVTVLNGGGRHLVHELNTSLERTSAFIHQLQQLHWLDHRTQGVFVDFSLFNINTNLLAVFSFLFEFSVSERVQSSLELVVINLCPVRGLDLQLLLTVVLLILVLYFLLRGVLGILRLGYVYLLSAWRIMGICHLGLAVSVCVLHLSRCSMANHQWALYLKQPQDTYTDFYALAKWTQTYAVMAALLLFILVLKASHQLRFLREWAVFGRALRHSVWELLGIAVTSLLVLLTYSHTGHLLFHSVLDGYVSVAAACLSVLGAGGRGLSSRQPSWTMTGPCSSASLLVFHTSLVVLRLLFLWLVTSVLLRNYRRARAELYRPTGDLQDYEMVELFLRRLKMWMGLSRTKEFRHKVRFEGMEPSPSRSSSTSDCKSLCLPPLDGPEAPPTPDSVDAGSEASWCPASSSPCSLTEAPVVSTGLGLGPGPGPGVSWRERAETEASLRRLLPTLDALLQQLDRVTIAMEDVHHLECSLERAHRKRREKGRRRGGQGARREKVKRSKKDKKDCGKNTANPRKMPIATPILFLKSTHNTLRHLPPSDPTCENQSQPKSTLGPAHQVRDHGCESSAEKETPPFSRLFSHPVRMSKRKPHPLKNKVHPHLSGPGPLKT